MRRGRAASLVIAATLLGTTVASAVLSRPGPADPVLVVTDPAGTMIARVPLPGAAFTLRYRNSLYGSVAEERFDVKGDRMILRELAADEKAVLDEYYSTRGGIHAAGARDPRPWLATPADDLSLTELAVAATDLGQRTVISAGWSPLELWRFVDDRAPTVVLSVRPARR